MKTIEKRLSRKTSFLVCMLLMPVFAVSAEQKNTHTGAHLIEEYVNSPINQFFKRVDELKAEDFSAVEKYLDSDPKSEPHGRAWSLAYEILERSREVALRRVTVEAILERSQIANLPSVGYFNRNAGSLPACGPEDFTTRSKQIILENLRILHTRGEVVQTAIELVGAANIPEALPILAEIEQKSWAKNGDNLDEIPIQKLIWRTYWQCLLTRARMGDKAALQQVLDVFDKRSSKEDWRPMIGSLAFTRSPEALQRIVTILNSDDLILDGTGGGFRYRGEPRESYIPVAPFAVAALREMLPEFPRDHHVTVEEARKWIKQNGATCRIAP